jgi:hypothetical protein
VHDLRDHGAHSWLLRHQGSAGERAKNEATVNLVTSRYPGTNSDVVVVVMAAPHSTAGSRSPGTTRIIGPAVRGGNDRAGTTERFRPVPTRLGPERHRQTDTNVGWTSALLQS